MKLLIATGTGEPEFSSNRGLIYGFRQLGHEVTVAGIPYWDRGFDADIVLPDRPHPEWVTYEEILDQHHGNCDWIICIEPHCYLRGPKPKGIKSAFFVTDPHRAGILYEQAVLEGQYDFFFVGQAHFTPFFGHLPTKVVGMWPGFDERRFQRKLIIPPQCDISFIGQTGLAGLKYPFKDECGQYADNSCLSKYFHMPPEEKFAFSGHPGNDYAERGEMLVQLSKYFDIRIYDSVWETPFYQLAIQKGRIGFNRSLLGDIPIRCFEILAANRFLISDELLLCFGVGADSYGRFFKPFFANFQLEAAYAARLIQYRLDNMEATKKLARCGSDDVWNSHTWQHRAEEILSYLMRS